ncbi:hypothetical protein L0U88_15155 [Flavihumibacter sp. RY-1]|uniref:HEAT repeat protein n=1 Tax=Flavihumibacter fluminis TaxID=2909236 RepID=A0ABS9BJU2_9BACT|nr:hypothetical protein [Flavihumibacter fluminis]MCF1715977.1 hypothetical protein [Flavihumibacter fluminis]
MKQLVTFIIVTFTLNCYGQRYQFDKTKISIQTKTIVAKIEKENMLMGSAVGNAGIRPKQFDNFTELKSTATTIELQELTNHPNGVVRCYSFWALTFDTSINLLPILIKHISDDENVRTMFGCVVSSEKVGDFFINLATPNYVNINSKKLDSFQFAIIDSILIYTPNNLYAKQEAISRAKLTERFYARAKDLVIKDKNQEALVTLAKYQKEQDIPLILKNKKGKNPDDGYFFTYRAICEFPHPDFFPFLENKLMLTLNDEHYSMEWRELYKAIASYKSNNALELLTIPFTQVKHENIKEYHIDFIFLAVQDFYTPIYDELLWTMWGDENKINEKVFNLLYIKNSDRAFQLTKKTLKNADDFYYLNTGSFSDDESTYVNLLDIMLDTILVRDRVYAIELINKNIREINVHQFPTFADKALKIRDTSFVSSLFDRLKTEDNPHIYLKATSVLIALKDKEIDQRIVEVAKTNPALRKDWGGRAFTKLLKENGIK